MMLLNHWKNFNLFLFDFVCYNISFFSIFGAYQGDLKGFIFSFMGDSASNFVPEALKSLENQAIGNNMNTNPKPNQTQNQNQTLI